MYTKEIDELRELMEREGWNPSVSKTLATLFVLSAEWGAGDAFAGLQMRNVAGSRPDLPERIVKLLKDAKYDVPFPVSSLDITLWTIMEKVNFKTTELNKKMRDLHYMALTGGRRRPEKEVEKDG